MGAFTCICTAVHSIYNTAVRLVIIIAWQQDVAAITIKCNEFAGQPYWVIVLTLA